MVCDFLEVLDPDVAVKIFKCLDHPADVVRASSVSRSWRDFVIANGICKHLCVKLFPQLSGVSRVINGGCTGKKFADIGCSRSLEREQLKFENCAYTCLARWLTSSQMAKCPSEAISASSTDNYPEESVCNTLVSRDRIGRRASYWSSSGQSNPEVPERLTYKLFSDLSIISEINVQPFQAFFQPNSPIYSAKAVRFRMGHGISPDGAENVMVEEGPTSTEGQFVWTYTSPEFPMCQENCLQNFKLPEPVLCIGGVLQIELLGRVQKQEMDDLFYICVAYVQIVGLSLSPLFGIGYIKPSGEFTLLYNSDTDSFGPSLAHDEADEAIVTPELMQTQVGGWEQILNLLRGAVGVEVYDSEDEQHESDEDMLEELAL